MNLTELLQKLSEIEPAVCKSRDFTSLSTVYLIGDYEFWDDTHGENTISASYKNTIVTGSPALAWLRDAVERECERRGWKLSIDQQNDWHIKISRGRQHQPIYGSRATLTTALLLAFVAACEASR